jgi:TolB-like protein/tetratricopeptide (TPR) repeat protein
MSDDQISFGQFRLDLNGRGLSRDGKAVPLGSRALDILGVLASARGDVVTKDQLMERVWPSRIVEENNIQVHISALRKALDDGKDSQSHVVTVPGRGYRLIGVRAPASAGETNAEHSQNAGDPGGPSIAVLPFQNMSNDPGQEHFTDGIVDEIITGLSRMRWLSVTARNSSSVYRGRSVNVKQVGRELGVRYVLEGSVRKDGNRVRITGQLIDSITGAHLWADHFDGGLSDIFDLQDKITASVVGAIEPTLIEAEIERTKKAPAASPYDYVMRGFASQRTWSREAHAEALRMFQQALQLDPTLSVGYAFASQCYTWSKSFGWLTEPASEIAEGVRLARRAIELGRSEPPTLALAGFAIAYLEGDLDFGTAAIDRALELNQNFAPAWGLSGWVKGFRGEPNLAIDCVQRAIQLSPVDAYMFAWQSAGSYALFSLGQYEEALLWAEKALRERPGYLPAARMIVASAALAEVPERPETSVIRLRELEPTLRVSNLGNQIPYRRNEDLARLADGLRKAGLPE